MGVQRSNVNRWVNEATDPAGDSVLEIGQGLRQINPDAAKEFIKLYLGNLIDD